MAQLFSENRVVYNQAEFALYLLAGFAAIVAGWWIVANYIEEER